MHVKSKKIQMEYPERKGRYMLDVFDDWDDILDGDFDSLDAPEKTPESEPAVKKKPPALTAAEPPALNAATPVLQGFDSADDFDDFDDGSADYHGEGYDANLDEELNRQKKEIELRASDPEAIAEYRRRHELMLEQSSEDDDFHAGPANAFASSDFEEEGYADEVADRKRLEEAENDLLRRRTSRRRSSREDMINKRAYNIEKRQTAPGDEGYDGYYENVVPADNGKSIHQGMNWKMVGAVLLMAAGLTVMFYYVFTTLGL